jgi:hypothetical protein
MQYSFKKQEINREDGTELRKQLSASQSELTRQLNT